ncbi:MAG: hypothetical protein JWN44_1867 [Myxococcales bacterium]|nr:hypothetical protein [Myxococcales bacterium]
MTARGADDEPGASGYRAQIRFDGAADRWEARFDFSGRRRA